MTFLKTHFPTEQSASNRTDGQYKTMNSISHISVSMMSKERWEHNFKERKKKNRWMDSLSKKNFSTGKNDQKGKKNIALLFHLFFYLRSNIFQTSFVFDGTKKRIEKVQWGWPFLWNETLRCATTTCWRAEAHLFPSIFSHQLKWKRLVIWTIYKVFFENQIIFLIFVTKNFVCWWEKKWV